MSDFDQQMMALQAEIEQQQAILADMEAEVVDLRQEIRVFERRYNRIVRPVEQRLEAVRDAISTLEGKRQRRIVDMLGTEAPQQDYWTPPEDYVSVEEQFRQTWYAPREAATEDAARPRPRASVLDSGEVSIKKLYRMLARRYHPDLAADPRERGFRNDLMARINEAYAQRDIDSLRALANQPENARPDQPLAALRLQEMRQIVEQLHSRIAALRLERIELQNGEMLRLALEEKLARTRGRDLLGEIVRQLEREYDAAMLRLERLRSRQ